MFSADVLVQISAADPRGVVEKIRQVAGVKQAYTTAGPTDCFVFIEGPELEALAATVMAVRAVEGVKRTVPAWLLPDPDGSCLTSSARRSDVTSGIRLNLCPVCG